MKEKLETEIQLKIDAIFEEIKREKSNKLSLMGDEMGGLIFLQQLSKINPSEKVLMALETKIEAAFLKINNIDHTTFASGLSGVGWTYNYLFKEGILDDGIESLLLQVDEVIIESVNTLLKLKDFDFLHGVIGQGIYILERKNYNLLSKIIDEIDSNATRNENGACWVSDFIIDDDFNTKKVYNISLSHGSSAIIVFLSKFLNSNFEDTFINSKAKKLLNEAVKFILSCKMNNNDSIFPTICEIENLEKDRGARLSWCYGDLGISIALWHAGVALQNETVKQEAINVCLHTTNRRTKKETGVVDAGICHGSAGIAHIYNKMYRYTGMKEFREAANYWIVETLNTQKFEDGLAGYKSYQGEKFGGWKNDYGLLEGVAGIGLVLLSHVSEEEPTWDRCLLLS